MPQSRVYSRQGSYRGLVISLGKSLAGDMRVFSARSLVGASGASSARGLAIVLSSGHRLVLWASGFHKDLHANYAGASRALIPMLSMVSVPLGSRVATMLVLGELPRQGSCRGCVGRPSKDLTGKNPFCCSVFCAPGWSAALVFLCFCFLPLPR